MNGIGSFDVKSLAFKPASRPVQVQGIQLALRALQTGDLGRLKEVYEYLSGDRVDLRQMGIGTVEQLVKQLEFSLPGIDANDSELIRVNRMIAENIEQAA